MPLTREAYKLIAVLLMLVDHVGAILLGNNILMRAAGRLAFPMFIMLLVDGFYHSKNLKKYAVRLIAFWAISIIPYSLAIFKQLAVPQQNVFATLFLCLCVLVLADNEDLSLSVRCVGAGVMALCAEILHLEYGWYAVALTIILYRFKKDGLEATMPRFMVAAMIFATAQKTPIQALSALSVVLLPLNGEFVPSEKPGKLTAMAFYLFYPLHLLCLFFLSV